MAELKALCMKCRNAENKPTMQVMKNPVVTKNDKGRYSAKGTCSVCGGNMFKFMSEADAKTMM
jgi:RNA:NAD 2'-phosphotransferase (TPT1/KptA family)